MGISGLQDTDIYENLLITKPNSAEEGGDGITVFGEGHPKCRAKKTIIRNCVIDFRGVPPHLQDEAISGVCGAVVDVENVAILGATKAVLCGNGDYPKEDKERGKWTFSNVAFIGCGRRCPEAQDGVKISMNRCLIEGWGEAFDTRSFGMWAHHDASIFAANCLFIQKSFMPDMKNFFVDLGNHFGQAFNDSPSALIDYFLPGVCRGASASLGGKVSLVSCFVSQPWIRLQGQVGEQATLFTFSSVIEDLVRSFRKNYYLYGYLKEACRKSVLFKGASGL